MEVVELGGVCSDVVIFDVLFNVGKDVFNSFVKKGFFV